MIYFIVALGFLIDVLFIIHDAEKHDSLSILLKTLASLSFVILAFYLRKYASDYNKASLIVYALIADLLGDFVLILRNIDKKHHDLIFIGGTLLFTIGHGFLMALLYKNNQNVIIKSFIFTVICFIFVEIYIHLRISAKKAFLIIGGIYLFFIIYILGYSIFSYIDIPNKFDEAFMFSYFLFMVSDLILTISKFKKDASITLQPIYRLSYFISQVLIALSIMSL